MIARARGPVAALLALAVLSTSGCTSSAPGIAELGTATYSGPLLGRHRLIESVPLDDAADTAARLASATLLHPSNVTVEHVWVVPVDETNGIEGVLRWPRPATEHDPGFAVLARRRPVDGFTLPARSKGRWMLTMIVRQDDPGRPVRSRGMTVRYALGGRERSTDLTTGFCFTVTADPDACTEP